MVLITRAWMLGKHAPSAFFDASSKQPRVAPEVLALAERQRLRA